MLVENRDIDDLERQASATAARYFNSALREVKLSELPEDQYGVVIAAMIRASASDFHTAVIAMAVDDINQRIDRALELMDGMGDWDDSSDTSTVAMEPF